MRAADFFRLSRWLLGLIAIGALESATARAQSADPPILALRNDTNGIVLDPPPKSRQLGVDEFNRQDCLDNPEVLFNLTLSGSATSGFNIDAWLGTACEDAAHRESAGSTCVKVATTSAASRTIRVPVRSLLQNPDGSSDAADVCASSALITTSATLTFMLLDANDRPPVDAGDGWHVEWPFSYDLGTPASPASVQAVATEGGLAVTWQATDSSPDLRDYVLLCDPPPSFAATGEAGAGPDDACESSQLPVGEVLTAAQIATLRCGHAFAGELSGEAAPLLAGTPYAVGVIARDQFYNPSPLSELACATPRAPAVLGASRPSHGGCAIGSGRTRGLDELLVLAFIGGMGRWRRRFSRGVTATARKSLSQ